MTTDQTTDQPETDQDTILAAAKAAHEMDWQCGLAAERIEAELRHPPPGPSLSDYPAMERAMVALEHAEARAAVVAADRATADDLRQKARDAYRRCHALEMRMDPDMRDAFNRWVCARYVTRFGRIEADGARSIEPHPEFLAQSSARGWR